MVWPLFQQASHVPKGHQEDWWGRPARAVPQNGSATRATGPRAPGLARIRQEAHEPLEATMEGLTRLWIGTANSHRRRRGRVKMALSGRLRLV